MICRRPHDPRLPNAVPPLLRRTAHGFSMTEMVWVVAVLGILAGMVIASVGTVASRAQETVAHEKLEMLNSALGTFAQTGSEINFPASSGSYSDEVVVLHYLQGRSTTNPQAGSPFVSPRYRPEASSSSEDYRLMWTGTMFKLLTPGQSGTGLKVPFDGSDLGQAWIQPPDWAPYGR